MVEPLHEQAAFALRHGERPGSCFIQRSSMHDYLRPELARGVDFGERRAGRHDNRGLDVSRGGSQRDSLGMVARTHRDESTASIFLAQLTNEIERAACLKR